MKKVKVYGVLLGLVFLLGFNVIFFAVGGFKHSASVWIAYSMIHASYAMLLCTPLFCRNQKVAVETLSPLFCLSGIHFLVHLILGIIFMLTAPKNCTFEIVLYAIIVVAYLVIFATLQLANAHTEESVSRRSAETFFVKNQASKLKMLIGRMSDKELDKLLEASADNMHASPVKSAAVAVSVEAGISMKVCEIELAINEERSEDAKKMLRELLYLIEERKRILSLNY